MKLEVIYCGFTVSRFNYICLTTDTDIKQILARTFENWQNETSFGEQNGLKNNVDSFYIGDTIRVIDENRYFICDLGDWLEIPETYFDVYLNFLTKAMNINHGYKLVGPRYLITNNMLPKVPSQIFQKGDRVEVSTCRLSGPGVFCGEVLSCVKENKNPDHNVYDIWGPGGEQHSTHFGRNLKLLRRR